MTRLGLGYSAVYIVDGFALQSVRQTSINCYEPLNLLKTSEAFAWNLMDMDCSETVFSQLFPRQYTTVLLCRAIHKIAILGG